MALNCKGCGGNIEYIRSAPLIIKGRQMGIECPLCNAWNTLVVDAEQGTLLSIDEWIEQKVKNDSKTSP